MPPAHQEREALRGGRLQRTGLTHGGMRVVGRVPDFQRVEASSADLLAEAVRLV